MNETGGGVASNIGGKSAKNRTSQINPSGGRDGNISKYLSQYQGFPWYGSLWCSDDQQS